VPQQQTNQSDTPSDTGSAPSSDFGANEWLVDEMYEQFQRDPGSVDPSWAAYFKTNGSSTNGGSAAPTVRSTTATAPQPAPTRAPAEAKAPTPEKAPADEAPEKAPAEAKAAPRATPRPGSAAVAPAKGTTTSVPQEHKEPEQSPAVDQPTYTVLRGAPARTVANMDDSLSVPTATSVRSVPVKLLWDNRIVINNHLSRARGGKVSFTHLIGYALVKALKAMPELNVGFDVVDGKPNQITPAHINLGLAIDMQKKVGTRQLLVPNI
jgi:2-oxoglutarate dehydrogenase E1 component